MTPSRNGAVKEASTFLHQAIANWLGEGGSGTEAEAVDLQTEDCRLASSLTWPCAKVPLGKTPNTTLPLVVLGWHQCSAAELQSVCESVCACVRLSHSSFLNWQKRWRRSEIEELNSTKCYISIPLFPFYFRCCVGHMLVSSCNRKRREWAAAHTCPPLCAHSQCHAVGDPAKRRETGN